MTMQLNQVSVQEMAYQVWEERGRPAKAADACWREAERRCREAQVRSTKVMDDALKASFPASDPPGSQLPDDVPVNADDKWAAAARSTGTQPLRSVTERKS